MTAGARGVRFGFPAPLFPDGVEPGTNILVKGPADSGAREVALRLTQPEPYRNEGRLLLSADVSGRHLLDRAREVSDGVDPERVGVVDCSGIADEDHRFDHHDHIEGPGDVMAIEMAVATLYETLRAKGFDRIRVGLFSVSAMLAHSDLRTVSRFIHMLTGRIIATGDLGVFYIDSSLDGDVSVEVVEHFCECTVEVRRRDDDVELRESDFRGGSSDWRPLDPQATNRPHRRS
ncbi:hypothetical protein NDI56_13050 [Haloarcula sp. S1CR25-12]|uniref:Recombinase RecA n=1 Tax=Haloarcula saliterrae TaxID=2950534 RepID=A0ABU2FDI4_9EURY|nr:hypothetical protein [Haloarcula sp. S1CR25-12]MDS0260325.1 hypothetical protein [Haloarcula sp. S1CR25-12]